MHLDRCLSLLASPLSDIREDRTRTRHARIFGMTSENPTSRRSLETLQPAISQKKPRRRRYLPGQERKREILDAALIEFLANGFTGTTVEGIATRAGMSKSGVYAHFESKDGIFSELLVKALPTAEDAFSVLLSKENASISDVAGEYIDKLYERLDNPSTVPTFQLLIAESRRVPDLIHRWHSNVLLSMLKGSQAMVDECVKRGVMRRNALTENFEIVLSPIVYWLVKRVLLGQDVGDTNLSLQKMRDIHKSIFLELLLPPDKD